VAVDFHFERTLAFSPETADDVLRSIPALPGVFALRGNDASAQPYLTRAADLRRRTRRLLDPPASQSKRLNLRDKVAFIDFCITGSEFESTLTLYRAAAALFGLPEARRRLKLNTPFFLRFTAENAHPRVYSTNRLSRRSLHHFYGPFASRAAADRYADAVLDLFKLRRCYEDLVPSPDHPGCVYQEMKKCLAPCNQGCTPEGAAAYAQEAANVEAFFNTHGESLLAQVATDRDHASADLDFERAAELHGLHQKVKAAAALASELVQPIPNLRAVILQPPARDSNPHPDEAAVFLLEAGCLLGPEPLSTLGVRAVKEQTSVGSSLFAQPLMLQAVPLTDAGTPAELTPVESPELRVANLLAALGEGDREGSREDSRQAGSERGRKKSQESPAPQISPTPDLVLLSDHLSLLRRWYYRPEKSRAGEIFFPHPDGGWPIRRILNGAARMALGDPVPMAETDREAAKAATRSAKVKVLHKGRPEVERVVPVYDHPDLALEPEDPASAPEVPSSPAVFTSRRSGARPDSPRRLRPSSAEVSSINRGESAAVNSPQGGLTQPGVQKDPDFHD